MEDAKRGECVLLDSSCADNDEPQFLCSHVSNAAMTHCPSPRRDGMSIHFRCENCESKPKLLIYQHKGQTFIEWDKTTVVESSLEERQFKREPIRPSVRFQVLKRDGYACQICGATAADGAKLEIDHIFPVGRGGQNDEENLQVLCRNCNIGKSDSFQ
jgi:5-methylcytosine-specific restriction endonuclease McrA